MKILYVGHTYSITANQAKIRELSALGAEITLVTPKHWKGVLYDHTADILEARGVRHYALPTIFAGRESAYLFTRGYSSLIEELRPDIAHVEQGTYAMAFAQTLQLLKRHSPSTRASFFTWWNLPYVPRGLKGLLEHHNLKYSAAAVAGNRDAEIILRDHGFPGHIRVIPQIGVDPADYGPRIDTSSGRFRVGYVGRVVEEKGCLDLARAMAQLAKPDRFELVVVGDGVSLSAMLQITGSAGLAAVQHIPAVRNEEIPRHLAGLDVLVLPSRTTSEWKEQFGHILIEAMAAGIPVIGSDSGEIPHVLADAGIVFEEGNIAELSDAISGLAENAELAAALSSKARQRVAERFTHAVVAKKTMEVFEWMREHAPSVGELAREAAHAKH